MAAGFRKGSSRRRGSASAIMEAEEMPGFAA